jgi:hypothetical protein
MLESQSRLELSLNLTIQESGLFTFALAVRHVLRLIQMALVLPRKLLIAKPFS